MGHYLTAMAQAYKQTKNSDANLNSQLKKQIDYTIDCLRAYQEASQWVFICLPRNPF